VNTSAKEPETNHNPKFFQGKLENYGINVMPDKNSSRKLHTVLAKPVYLKYISVIDNSGNN